ncbi:GntR family transcriptional regulator [Ramlibacter sp.]|uniref:GntR family transcriptional regulator n=1 Tax=Ramlibacter sp. TaxID=1917967 RepID=UPI002607CD1A|nr:GntR family transcriptional regulator [Ramlibacter sp.]MDB5953464.1 transcriptional regulator, GntR family [Ramlibacter sp.]
MEAVVGAVAQSVPEIGRARDRSRTLAQELQRTLEALIVSGALMPGARLEEAELVERFQTSRTPVREALKALAGHGLVEMHGAKGARVTRISVPTLIEMFEVMSVLEGLCARHAARRATPAQREHLAGLHARLELLVQGGDAERFYEVNSAFHDALYEASNTAYVAKQARMLRKRLHVYRRHVTTHPGRMAATIGEHGAILSAIDRRDPESAYRAAYHHVELLQDDMVDLIAAVSHQLAGND